MNAKKNDGENVLRNSAAYLLAESDWKVTEEDAADLEQLLARLKLPPQTKVCGKTRWSILEKELGIIFPNEFKFTTDFLGLVEIGNITNLVVNFPLKGSNISIENLMQNYKLCSESAALTKVKLFPEEKGLIMIGELMGQRPCIYGDFGGQLSEKPSIIFVDYDYYEFKVYNCGFARFLNEIISKEGATRIEQRLHAMTKNLDGTEYCRRIVLPKDFFKDYPYLR